MKKYFSIWWRLLSIQSQIALTSRFGAFLFTLGKVLRFAFFLLFLLLIVEKTKVIAGYTLWQVILFFATFNFVDVSVQFLLREVYRFRNYVLSGDFDYFLLRPFSVLFRSLFGGSDLLDISMVFLSLIVIIVSFPHLQINILGISLYTLLILNAFIIAVAMHIVVLAIGVITTTVDNAIMLYRDLTQMGRVPIDVYKEPLRGFITFIIPVGIMMAFPAKALLGLLSLEGVAVAFVVSAVLVAVSLQFWHFALKHYSSASS